ncbi:MAG: hypothetical protein LBL45_10240 [Treponema sp.]|nr:hypothetical protein [Treponema sp.]
MAYNNDATRRSARYSCRGAILRNGNFDGSAVTPQRMLGAPEIINLNQTRGGVSILNASKQGVMLIRVDDNPAQIKSVSFAHAVDIENVTPAEVVIGINNAGYSGVSCVIDTETGAPNLQASSPDTICVQAFSLLAGALGFGGGKPFRSFGCFLYDGLTWKDIIQLTTARQLGTEAAVSLANGYDGGTTVIMQKSSRAGDQVTWSIRNKDYILLQMAEGGVLAPRETGGLSYMSPMPEDDVGERSIELWAIYGDFEDGVRQTLDEESFIPVKHYYKGQLSPQDDAEGAATIATISFLYDAAAVYNDPMGGRMGNPAIDKFTLNEWRTWRLKDCLIKGLSAGFVNVIVASQISVAHSTISMVNNQIAYNALGATPSNAGGFSISFSTPTVLTDLILSYDPDSRRIRILSGGMDGSDTITVTAKNGDSAQSSVTTTFTVVVT